MRTTLTIKPFGPLVHEFRAFFTARSLDETLFKTENGDNKFSQTKNHMLTRITESNLKIHVERISNRNRQRHHRPWPKPATQYFAAAEGKHLSN